MNVAAEFKGEKMSFAIGSNSEFSDLLSQFGGEYWDELTPHIISFDANGGASTMTADFTEETFREFILMLLHPEPDKDEL